MLHPMHICARECRGQANVVCRWLVLGDFGGGDSFGVLSCAARTSLPPMLGIISVLGAALPL